MYYHSLKKGPDSKGVAETIKKALEICQEEKIDQLAIAVHTKDQLRANTISDVLGKDFIKALNKNNYAKLGDLEIFLITERINPTNFTKGPIVGFDISIKFLKRLSNDTRATDIIFKGWTEEEQQEYLNLFKSEPI